MTGIPGLQRCDMTTSHCEDSSPASHVPGENAAGPSVPAQLWLLTGTLPNHPRHCKGTEVQLKLMGCFGRPTDCFPLLEARAPGSIHQDLIGTCGFITGRRPWKRKKSLPIKRGYYLIISRRMPLHVTLLTGEQDK